MCLDDAVSFFGMSEFDAVSVSSSDFLLLL